MCIRSPFGPSVLSRDMSYRDNWGWNPWWQWQYPYGPYGYALAMPAPAEPAHPPEGDNKQKKTTEEPKKKTKGSERPAEPKGPPPDTVQKGEHKSGDKTPEANANEGGRNTEEEEVEESELGDSKSDESSLHRGEWDERPHGKTTRKPGSTNPKPGTAIDEVAHLEASENDGHIVHLQCGLCGAWKAKRGFLQHCRSNLVCIKKQKAKNLKPEDVRYKLKAYQCSMCFAYEYSEKDLYAHVKNFHTLNGPDRRGGGGRRSRSPSGSKKSTSHSGSGHYDSVDRHKGYGYGYGGRTPDSGRRYSGIREIRSDSREPITRRSAAPPRYRRDDSRERPSGSRQPKAMAMPHRRDDSRERPSAASGSRHPQRPCPCQYRGRKTLRWQTFWRQRQS